MGGTQGLLDVLDTRSFSSMWYWLLLTLLWTWVGRGALGIPSELVATVRRRARGDGTPAASGGPAPESLLLLDWLSLVLPRWRIAPRDGMILLAAATFLLTLLAGLGFGYGRQTGQALFLLLAPLALLLGLRLRLAARLAEVLTTAETGRATPDAAASQAARLIGAHMRATMGLSILAVGSAALWGTYWLARHPNGL